MTNEGFLRLMEAIMELAYNDANKGDDEAKAYIEKMKNLYGNM